MAEIESPLRQIRKYCVKFCMNNSYMEVEQCPSGEALSEVPYVGPCPLYQLRLGRGVRGKGISALKAIRAKCIDCSAGFLPDVKNCTRTDCYLYPYRMGKGRRKRKPLTEEQRKAVADRFAKAREKKKK